MKSSVGTNESMDPRGLTVRVNSSPHWGRRRAPGPLDHYRRGRSAPTHRRGPIRITCYNQTNTSVQEQHPPPLISRPTMQKMRPANTTACIHSSRDPLLLFTGTKTSWKKRKEANIWDFLPWRGPAAWPEFGLKRGARRSLSWEVITASLWTLTVQEAEMWLCSSAKGSLNIYICKDLYDLIHNKWP